MPKINPSGNSLTMTICGAWAKLDQDGSALPLVDHAADVAAVMAQLLSASRWRSVLETAAGRGLDPRDCARLAVFAAIHDLGKCNRGFWRRQIVGQPRVGHTNVTAALFQPPLCGTSVGARLRTIIKNWDADELFQAVMAHHGLPLDGYSQKGSGACSLADRVHWEASGAYDPVDQLTMLFDDVEARFPLAFEPGPPLPSTPAFVAAFGGLVTLADWLGSDTRLFPVAAPHLAARDSLRAAHAPHAVAERGLAGLIGGTASFEDIFGFSPRGVQHGCARLELGQIALIEAETGSGKTEAALWRWLALRAAGQVDGLYFALPTRSAAVQLHARVDRMLKAVFGGTVEAVLAVPGYLRAGDADGQALPDFAVTWSDGANTDARWAAEAPKRFLAARVAVGTIDQVLLAGLQVRHAHFRAAMLARSLLVVDEVHASDAFMEALLRGVLRNHVAVGGHALLLSATLGAEARARLLDPCGSPVPSNHEAAVVCPYPALSGSAPALVTVPDSGRGDKAVRIELQPLLNDADAIAQLAVTAARAGASVLVVRNSVAGAVAVARAIAARAPDLAFRVNGVATLHHGRFAPSDRRLLDAEVDAALGRGRSAEGRVLCGTQTLEQSLDIDADLLITDLAPIDVLLQRIGRLHRHDRTDRGAFRAARAVVLVPDTRDLSRYFARVADRHGLGPQRDGSGVYPDLLVIEATLRLLEASHDIAVPRDNRRLVEGALHGEVLAALAEELGTGWMNHAAQQSGIRFAERQSAERYGLDLRAPFSSLLFPVDETVSTRLGTRDRVVEFDPPLPGPFGQPVRRLTIPAWMAKGVSAEDEPRDVFGNKKSFSFRLGNYNFVYDSCGLAKVG